MSKQYGAEERVVAQLAQVVGCCSPLAREPLSAAQSVELARVFKAMGDPVRLRLLSLTDVFDLSGPTISHHLKVLREAGLITGERRSTWVYYRVHPELLAQVSAVLLPAAPDDPATVGTLPVVEA